MNDSDVDKASGLMRIHENTYYLENVNGGLFGWRGILL